MAARDARDHDHRAVLRPHLLDQRIRKHASGKLVVRHIDDNRRVFGPDQLEPARRVGRLQPGAQFPIRQRQSGGVERMDGERGIGVLEPPFEP